MTQKADGCRKIRTVSLFIYRACGGWYNGSERWKRQPMQGKNER